MVAEKITLEELRSRVFRLYYGVPLIWNSGYQVGYLHSVIGKYVYYRDTAPIHLKTTDAGSKDYQAAEAINLRLALKPMSAISNEHAIEICRMLVHDNVEYPAKDYKITQNLTLDKGEAPGTIASIRVEIDNDHFQEVIHIGCRTGTVWLPYRKGAKVGPEIYDFLRQNGYAINYGPWSVDQLKLVEGQIFTFIDPK